MLPATHLECNAVVDGVSPSSSSAEESRRSKSRFFSKPSWLLLSISDMEDKIEAVNGEDKPDTFGERADFYYRKRPELLALLQDLYNRYLYLADRYTRTLSKQQKQEHEHLYPILHDINTNNDHYSNDPQISVSYQPQKPNPAELVISELVMKFVEYDFVIDELQNVDMIQEESRKKIELQKSLLEVLESERVVLTNENSRLASESLFMKRKAGELARCVLLERTEDQRVFVLSRKIDDLQGQIYELEKRNKEYYDKLMKQQVDDDNKNEVKKNNISISIKRLMVKNNSGGGDSSGSISWSGGEDETGCSMSSTSNSSTCTSLAQVMKDKNNRKKKDPRGSDGGGGKKWWDRVKKFDVFMCGPHLDATC